ncbi:beta-galactosidase [Echinicola pacifica]|uniref:beta-galactosidase n=1 Tax=Echinicola pacifica TaxID=346377 RepID=A0A918QA27_9BACT|nr:glycoside hydrolase family 2 [Echinicola pacifica]GGZ38572.1 beta-galactosidase [Echinicola pacifica]
MKLQNRPLGLIVLLMFTFLNVYGRQESESQTQIIYLSGTGKDDMVDWDFYCSAGMNSGKWSKIGVPSCWELQGFGAYNYGHDPFEQRLNEYGLYKTTFVAPETWAGKTVKLVFEGVMTDAEVKVNGKLAGEIHQGAFYEFNYTINDLVNYGAENTLEVKVNKSSSNESINFAERKADFWIFGGIFRPVYLEVLPADPIDRLAIDARADGSIVADVFFNSSNVHEIQARLLDDEGKEVQELPITIASRTAGKWTLKTFAKEVREWNPESPNLYILQVNLLDHEQNILHQRQQKIGFRTVQVRAGDGIYVNGQRIKFKGVNRHSFYPTSGRTMSKALSIEHVQLMKEMNMNAVRMSHYPPDKHFLDACDSLGLFVIDEVCTWQSPALDTQVGRKLVRETVVRDVNHPSIVLWANGNEGGWNPELDDDYALWDIQQREVIHPWAVFRKTNTVHYGGYHGLAYDAYSQDKIFFPTEFMHGLYDGGHGAGLEDYWNLMWQMPLGAGGFLWDFADEAVVRVDKDGVLDSDGNHAADGIIGPYGEKEASFYTIKEIWSPIFIENRFIREGFNGKFTIENRFHFTALNHCKMYAKWVKFTGLPTTPAEKILARQELSLPALEPGHRGSFQVPLIDDWQSADVLYLTAHGPQGEELFTWSYPVKSPEQQQLPISHATADQELEVQDIGDHITVKTSDFAYRFSKINGQIMGLERLGNSIPLNGGPLILGQSAKVDTVLQERLGDQLILTIFFEAKDNTQQWSSEKRISSDKISWTIYPSGQLDLMVSMKSRKNLDDYKGITFSFPEEEVRAKQWIGDGPYRVWRNRTKGTQFGLWENEYNDTVTGEEGFIYPEFKGFFSNVYWLNVQGKHENGFKVYCKSPFTFLRMFTPKQPSDPKNGAGIPAFPEGNISFVKNIPPVGTKFHTADELGPHGNAQTIVGNDDEAINMEFTFIFDH